MHHRSVIPAFTALVAAGILIAGCDSKQEKENKEKQNGEKEQIGQVSYDQTDRFDIGIEEKEEHIKKAFAVVNPKNDSEVVGTVTFTEVEGGVRIMASIGGLTPGKHGFHIHEHGDCSAHDGSSAGGHFNPTNKKHGGPESFERHLGDLGNLEANKFGRAVYDRVDKDLSLNGEYSIVGKSVVVHEGEDDLQTDPSGNSGKRIGCGEIIKAKG